MYHHHSKFTYHTAADAQKELCLKGLHFHSVMDDEDEYYLMAEKPEHRHYECCPCFGCCNPRMRRQLVN